MQFETMRIKVDCDFLILIAILDVIEAKELFWCFDSHISNTENWVGEKLAKDCKGVHFAPVNTAPVYIQQLTTPEITLPVDGELGVFDGGWIEFKDNKKCIKLKPINYHNWYDHESWKHVDNNVAIPHKQRIPCSEDDVTFPTIIHSRVYDNMETPIRINSLKFGDQVVGNTKLEVFTESKVGHDIFYNPLGPFNLYIHKTTCEDSYGCLCHPDFVPCPLRETREKVNCLNPVEPEEFCEAICGAYVTYKPGTGPRLSDVRKKLKEYQIDTYASRVKNYLGNEVVQVVFSEKEFTGKSLTDAETFLQYLKYWNAENVQILKSGEFYMEGTGSSTVSIVFGSLVGVVVFFGILFYLQRESSSASVTLILNRFNKARGSVFNVPFFARFDNTDENLIIDSQSEVGSILDIAKSFDNPMYGQSSTGSGTQHENPLYEVTKEEDADVEE